MSVKIYAATHNVANHERVLQENLFLPMIDDEFYLDPFYDVSWCHSLPPFSYDGLYDTQPYPYRTYFECSENGTSSFLRLQYFDTIRALGLSEMWVMGEDDVYNYPEEEGSLYHFIDCLTRKYQCIEFDIDDYNKGGDFSLPPICHDDFKDCFRKVERIEQLYDLKVLGLRGFNGKIRVVKSGKVMLLNEETGELTSYEV